MTAAELQWKSRKAKINYISVISNWFSIVQVSKTQKWLGKYEGGLGWLLDYIYHSLKPRRTNYMDYI